MKIKEEKKERSKRKVGGGNKKCINRGRDLFGFTYITYISGEFLWLALIKYYHIYIHTCVVAFAHRQQNRSDNC